MPNDPNAIILCGGAGLRLRSVIGDAPKGMAEIAGRPFLEVLLRQLAKNGINRTILAVGYQGEIIKSHFGSRAFGMELIYSLEEEPLGTGGALRNALQLACSDSILVMNGDSYTDVNLREFLADYQTSEAEASIVVVHADGRSDCGFVRVGEQQNIFSFIEKGSSEKAAWTNAGVYLLATALASGIQSGCGISLEREVLPQWLTEGRRLRAFLHSGTCVDIGTPERFRKAQVLLSDVETELTSRGCENRL